MSSLNRVTLIGNLGKDPEMRATASGDAVCNFSVATTEKWKDKAGDTQERTEWHKVTAWRQLAEVCGKFLGKGSKVYVEGKLQTREYEKDGIKRYSTEIVAYSVLFLSFKEKDESGAPATAKAAKAQWDEVADADLPF